MLRGITEAGRLGKWGWAYKKQRPKSQLPCLQGAPSHCLQRKGPGTPGHGCSLTYRAAPIPTAGRGSFSPSPGHLDPHPANGAVTPHRLPAEHKRSRTQTLITGGWTTPLEPQSSVSPPAAGTTLSSQAAGLGDSPFGHGCSISRGNSALLIGILKRAEVPPASAVCNKMRCSGAV